MVIWSGFGILAGIIPMLCYVGFVRLCQYAYGVAYTDSHGWPGAIGTMIGGIAVYVVSKRLDAPARTLLDPATGQSVILKRRRNSLFFIPMEYWSYILILVAFWMLLIKHKSDL